MKAWRNTAVRLTAEVLQKKDKEATAVIIDDSPLQNRVS